MGAQPAVPAPGKSKHQIMLSPSLQHGLRAQLGGDIVIMVQDRNGMQQALVAEVTGIIDVAMVGFGNDQANLRPNGRAKS